MAPSILPKLNGSAYTSNDVRQALAVVSGIYPEIADVVRLAQRLIVRLEDDKQDALSAVVLKGHPEQFPARIEYAREVLRRDVTVASA